MDSKRLGEDRVWIVGAGLKAGTTWSGKVALLYSLPTLSARKAGLAMTCAGAGMASNSGGAFDWFKALWLRVPP